MTPLALVLLLAAAPEPLRLGLDEVVSRARATAPRLAQARAQGDAAASGVRAARAQRLPSVEIGGNYSRHSHVPELTLTLPGAPPRTLFPDLPNTWRARAAVTLPLYTGGRVEAGIEGATALASAAEADRDAAVHDVVLQAVDAYWALATARAAEQVLQEALASYDAHLRDAQARFDAGLAARNELLAVQVEHSRAELARRQADHQAALAAADLARLVGAEPGQVVEVTDTLAAAEAPNDPPGDALARRAELVALRHRLEAAEASVRGMRSARRPQASAQAAVDHANPNPRILPLADAFETTWSVGVSFTWTPWDGGRTQAAVAQAEAQARALRHQLEDAEQRVRLDVTARTLALDTALAAVEVAARAREAARENVRVAADRYREGVASSSDLLDAETMLLRAGLEHTQALADTQRARAARQRAIGEDIAP